MGGVLLRGLGRLCEVPREALGLEGTPSPGSLLGGVVPWTSLLRARCPPPHNNSVGSLVPKREKCPCLASWDVAKRSVERRYHRRGKQGMRACDPCPRGMGLTWN